MIVVRERESCGGSPGAVFAGGAGDALHSERVRPGVTSDSVPSVQTRNRAPSVSCVVSSLHPPEGRQNNRSVF